MQKTLKISVSIILLSAFMTLIFCSCIKKGQSAESIEAVPDTSESESVLSGLSSTTSGIEEQLLESTTQFQETISNNESFFVNLVEISVNNKDQIMSYDDDIIVSVDTEDPYFADYCDATSAPYRVFEVGKYWYILPEIIKTSTLGDYEYALHKNGKIQLIKYLGNDVDIVIPNEISGYPVAYIGESLFEESNIKSVKMGENVIFIGPCAFMESKLLEEVDLSNNIKVISTYSFSCCLKLKNLLLPNSLEIIGYDAFSFCDLNKVIIPNSVKYLGCGAFGNCYNLKEIEFEGGTMCIEAGIICDTAVETLYLPENLTIDSLGGIFACEKLEKVEYASTMNEKTVVFAEMFYGCSNLREIKLANNITKIGEYAFQGCYSLKEIHIPKAVQKIDFWAFSQCYSLRNVYFESADCDGLDEAGFVGQVRIIHAPAGGNIEEFCLRHPLLKFIPVI